MFRWLFRPKCDHCGVRRPDVQRRFAYEKLCDDCYYQIFAEGCD